MMLVEVLGGHDRVRLRHRVTGSGVEAHCTVGRSAECDVVLDDPFVAPVHARITVDTDGTVVVSDLDTVNGIEIAGRRLHGVQRAPLANGVFRLGRTRVRVRTAHDVIGPEQVDRSGQWRTRVVDQRRLAAGIVVTIGMTAFEVWSRTQRPRDLSTALVALLLGILAAAGLWTALWALASRVAFGESRWVRHATTLFVVYAALLVVNQTSRVVNGALGLHLSSFVISSVLFGVAACTALFTHLVDASPMRRRTALGISVTISMVLLVATLWIQARAQNRNASHIADDDLVLPPALLLRRGVSLDRFTAELGDLRAKADAKRAFVEREASDDSD